MLKAFSYWNDIWTAIQNHEEFPVDEIHSAGSRKSGKSYSHEEGCVVACNIIDKDFKPVKVVCYGLRNNLQKVPELYSEFQQTLDRLGFWYDKSKTERKFTFDNNNWIRVMHLHSQGSVEDRSNWSGLARAEDAEYIIIFAEEAYEYEMPEVQRFIEAVRGNKHTKILIIWNCNPWSRRSKYIQFLDNHLKFCEYKLRTNGQQWKLFTEKKQEKGVKARKMLFHYTNWRVNKENLSPSDIQSILGVYRTDPDRAKTTDLGMPGYQQGAIYAYLLKYVKEPIWQRHRYIGGGGDFGYGDVAKSGITSFVFGGFSQELGIDIYEEWHHDNKVEELDPVLQAEQIVKFYEDCRVKYYNRTGYLINGRGELCIICDYNDLMSISTLNKIAERKRLHWLRFDKSKKYKINDRIMITKYYMAKERLRINPLNSNLLAEFEVIQWDRKKFKQEVRENTNDHSINAFEYFIEPVMGAMIEDKDKTSFRKMLSPRTNNLL